MMWICVPMCNLDTIILLQLFFEYKRAWKKTNGNFLKEPKTFYRFNFPLLMKSVIILWNMYYKQGPIFSTPRPMNFYKQNLLTIYNNMQVTMTLLETNFWYCGLWPDYSILKIFNSMIAGPRLCIMFIIIILIFQQLGGGIWTLNIYGKNTRRGQLIELQYLFFFFLFSFFFLFFCIKRDFIANWKYKTETSKSYKLQTTWLDNHRYKHIKLYNNTTTTKTQ